MTDSPSRRRPASDMPASRQRAASDMKRSRKPDDRSREEKRRAAFLKQRLTQRVRDLFLSLMADKGDAGAYVESQCLKVAELTVAAEGLRAKLDAMLGAANADVKSLAALINGATRLESTARRAAADLAKTAAAKPKLTLLEQKLRRDGKL